MVLVGAMDPFWPGDRSFRAVGGGGGGLWPTSRARCVSASPSGVYPAGRLQ